MIQNQHAMHKAAEDYYNQYRWTCMPLRLDPSGLPKRPIVPNWTQIKQYMPAIDALPWNDAAGLGILLGPSSDNLAVIDIDSKSLARTLYDILTSHGQETYMVRTARGNCHLYIKEVEPSPSSKFPVTWEDEQLYVELKAAGTQVAAPPSPGYTIISNTLLEWQSLGTFWELLDARLRYLHSDRYSPGPSRGPDGSVASAIQPWQEEVVASTRNNTLYVEAHRLREAGMPYQEAVAILTTRVRQSYQEGREISDQEITQTVASAYRKGVVTRIGDDTTSIREFSPL